MEGLSEGLFQLKTMKKTNKAELTGKPRNNPLEASILKRLKSKKFYYVVGTWIGIAILIVLFTSCAPLEPLPGLCYTDKTGTYLCHAPANSQQHEVPTSYEPKSTKTPTTINIEELKDSLVCMEEQDHGIFIDVCKGVIIIPINIDNEDKE